MVQVDPELQTKLIKLRLQLEVEELKKENDFLKKTAAFFAKENR